MTPSRKMALLPALALALTVGSAPAQADVYQFRFFAPGLNGATPQLPEVPVAPVIPTLVGDGVSKAGACASGAVGCATWSGSLFSPERVLSANGLTLSSSAGSISTTANVGKSAGKWYFEATTPNWGIQIGVCRADLGSYWLHTPNCYGGDGFWWYSNGVSSRTNLSWFGTATLAIKLNLDARTMTLLRNNVEVKTVSLPMGEWTPAIGGSADSNPVVFPVLSNFGQSEFKYPVPAGYNAGLW